MRKYGKDFCIRGAMFAWGGPVILAMVYGALQGAGVLTSLTVDQVVLGIVSTTVMAFIAAGISIVYQIENLPKAFAGLIQMAVLYADYLGFYLLNGWVSGSGIWIFTGIFVAGFAVIWFSIFIPIKLKVNKMNRMLNQQQKAEKTR